jgi:hypothetical protein
MRPRVSPSMSDFIIHDFTYLVVEYSVIDCLTDMELVVCGCSL